MELLRASALGGGGGAFPRGFFRKKEIQIQPSVLGFFPPPKNYKNIKFLKKNK